MKLLQIIMTLGILMPMVVLGQGTTLRAESTETTGIEHEDIGVVGTDGSSDGSSAGNVETEFKVEEGERAGAEIEVTGSIDKASPKLMQPNTDGTHDEQDDTSSNWIRISQPSANDGSEKRVVQYNESDLDFLSRSSISVKAVEVRGWDVKKKEEFLGTVKNWAKIQSGQELENFAKGVLVHDENIESINLDEETTTVEYRMPAKLFGIFNSSLKVSVEADKQSRIKVKFPWLGFLFKKSVSANELKADMESSLPEIDDEIIVGFENRAQVLLIINDVLKTRYESVKNSVNNVR